MNRRELGRALKRDREAAGLLPRQMATAARMSLGGLLDCESGQGEEAHLIKYAEALAKITRREQRALKKAGAVSQMGEGGSTCKPRGQQEPEDAGSSPAGTVKIHGGVAQMVEHRPNTAERAGSDPAASGVARDSSRVEQQVHSLPAAGSSPAPAIEPAETPVQIGPPVQVQPLPGVGQQVADTALAPIQSEITEQLRPTKTRRVQGARRASEISRFSVAREPRVLGPVRADYVPLSARELEA